MLSIKCGITGINIKKYQLLDKYEIKLKAFQALLDNLRIEVEEFIQTIEDSELRRILRYRYHDDFSWIKIMHLMEYESEDKARKKVNRLLEKIE